MNYITASIGIILAFAWMVFIANQQRKEIVSLKAQLLVERSYTKGLETDVTTCSGDNEFLKQGLEQVIYVQEHGLI